MKVLGSLKFTFTSPITYAGAGYLAALGSLLAQDAVIRGDLVPGSIVSNTLAGILIPLTALGPAVGIQRCIFRKKHFSYFLESLTIAERYSLEERFKDEKDTVCSQNLIERILDEINEIEIAICYREGIEVFDLEKRETYEDADINLGRMCDFFEL